MEYAGISNISASGLPESELNSGSYPNGLTIVTSVKVNLILTSQAAVRRISTKASQDSSYWVALVRYMSLSQAKLILSLLRRRYAVQHYAKTGFPCWSKYIDKHFEEACAKQEAIGSIFRGNNF